MEFKEIVSTDQLTGTPLRKKPLSSVEQRQWVKRFHKSGMSRRAFCLAHGLKLPTFLYWLKKAKVSAMQGQGVGHSTLTPPSSDTRLSRAVSPQGVCQFEFPNGVVLRVAHRLDKAFLCDCVEVALQCNFT